MQVLKAPWGNGFEKWCGADRPSAAIGTQGGKTSAQATVQKNLLENGRAAGIGKGCSDLSPAPTRQTHFP